MNLISCSSCAVVLDKDNLCFPHYIWKDDGYGGNEVDLELAIWNGDGYVAFTTCPVCSEKILEE